MIHILLSTGERFQIKEDARQIAGLMADNPVFVTEVIIEEMYPIMRRYYRKRHLFRAHIVSIDHEPTETP